MIGNNRNPSGSGLNSGINRNVLVVCIRRISGSQKDIARPVGTDHLTHNQASVQGGLHDPAIGRRTVPQKRAGALLHHHRSISLHLVDRHHSNTPDRDAISVDEEHSSHARAGGHRSQSCIQLIATSADTSTRSKPSGGGGNIIGTISAV